MIPTEIPKYTTRRIAQELGVSVQWARTLCRRVVGRRRCYRLSPSQFDLVKIEYETYRHEIE